MTMTYVGSAYIGRHSYGSGWLLSLSAFNRYGDEFIIAKVEVDGGELMLQMAEDFLVDVAHVHDLEVVKGRRGNDD